MSNIYEQKFYSALKDTFIGHPIKGKSGYVNLMDIKANYFAEIEPYIKDEIDKKIKPKFREELFEKLFNFFDCYLNETGTVFFANSQIHKNLYEKVYSDREDVSLFWKTQKLYYVKSEANYEDLQTEVNGINILFDASEIKHAKGNEKKTIEFYLIKATKKEVVFKIRYKEQNKYDRLREYLELKKTADIQDKLIENYSEDIHPNIYFEDTTLDFEVFARVTDARKNIYFEDIEDALNSVKIEYSISDLDLMLQYLQKKGIILHSEDVKKIFSIYKRQNEIDYFIHKDAEGFLKEQFDIYVYNWLFNDLETDFDAPTVQRMQNIKKIAHKVIEYIARFEDELKAIWEKPKFVKNCNYVLTLDKLANNLSLIQKLMNSDGWKTQVSEWNNLELINNKNDISKIENILHLFIDTKYFENDLVFEILSTRSNLDREIDGILIKSDNWQALNTIVSKYEDRLDLIYIDPPFNTGSDFVYKDKYQDSTWLTLMENRLFLAKQFLSKKGSFFLHLDPNADHYGRILLDKTFGSDSFRNEIIWGYGGGGAPKIFYPNKHDTLFWYTISKEKGWIFNKQYRPYSEKTLERGLTEVKGDYTLSDEGAGLLDIWNDDKVQKILSPTAYENVKFETQKPEGLMNRIIYGHSEESSYVMDFFSGSGTTFNTAQKLGRKWISVEMGEHFSSINLPRIKKTISGFISGISPILKEAKKLKSGGFFKYYELEQYEEVLAKAKYQWQGDKNKKQVEQYSFLQDEKLLDAIEIDYKEKNAKVVFENLYPNIDIAETLSNVSGKHIKQIFEDKVIFEDDSEVVYAEMTFEKYPWIKPLIWWNSK